MKQFFDKILNTKSARPILEQSELFDLEFLDWLNRRNESGLIHREEAIVKDNGLRNLYTVDFKIINSKLYHDKFMGLTMNRNVDEALYKRAAKMFENRTGSEYEDIAAHDARTGKMLEENTSASGDYKFMAGFTEEQVAHLKELGRPFEILHNHPAGTPPSANDAKSLFEKELAVASTIAGHDGSVYRMEKLK